MFPEILPLLWTNPLCILIARVIPRNARISKITVYQVILSFWLITTYYKLKSFYTLIGFYTSVSRTELISATKKYQQFKNINRTTVWCSSMNQFVLLEQPRECITVLETKCWVIRHSGCRTPARVGLSGLALSKITGLWEKTKPNQKNQTNTLQPVKYCCSPLGGTNKGHVKLSLLF